jgi:hypothetical protein
VLSPGTGMLISAFHTLIVEVRFRRGKLTDLNLEKLVPIL